MGDNTFNQYKCADSNYGRVEKCEIPGQFCFTSFTDWDGDKGIRFNFVSIDQIKESIRSCHRIRYRIASLRPRKNTWMKKGL